MPWKKAKARLGKLGSVKKTGMGIAFEEDGVGRPDEGGDDPEWSEVACGKKKGLLGLLPLSESSLQGLMFGTRPGKEAGGSGTGAMVLHRLLGGANHGGVPAETEVVII